ncbi:hypothetical protein DSO57_1027624 [Entomophthora muscae]|uniref:Uncharacterized protein n=1 Tax=Entomophthora muscae TaxID=34485 RepID=A0ACC2TNW3_9FUNG|nr:hypothetical protein DSO57_1027624 [Entomophthora muscae]
MGRQEVVSGWYGNALDAYHSTGSREGLLLFQVEGRQRHLGMPPSFFHAPQSDVFDVRGGGFRVIGSDSIDIISLCTVLFLGMAVVIVVTAVVFVVWYGQG